MALLSKKNKKGLLPVNPEVPRKLGNLDQGFDRRVPVIFPTHSPVNMLGGRPEEPVAPMKRSVFSRISNKIMEKLAPLVRVKKDMDDVYSRGYFENHYPEVDKKMKGLLHDHAMAAAANASGEDDGPLENSGPKITITVNLEK